MKAIIGLAVGVLGFGGVLVGQHQHGGSQGAAQGGHMDHRFDDAEKYAKQFDDPARDAWQMPARVIDALGLRPGQSVADVGAGTGYFTVRLDFGAGLFSGDGGTVREPLSTHVGPSLVGQ